MQSFPHPNGRHQRGHIVAARGRNWSGAKPHMKILIADDHALLRQGLRQNLAEAFPEAEFYETGTTQETLDCINKHALDVVVLDIFLPGRSGLEVLDDIRRNHPSIKVLVLSSAPEEQLGLRVLKGGAS